MDYNTIEYWLSICSHLSPIDFWKFLFYGYWITFICLMLTATIGRRLRIRRAYVNILDKIFQFAAVKLDYSDETLEEEGEDINIQENENVVICPESPRAGLDKDDHSGEYKLHQTMPYMSAAMSAIVSDCVTRSFTSEQLPTWNMLSRTRRKEYLKQSKSLTIFWLVGCFIRYVFLMPMRVLVLTLSLSTLFLSTSCVGFLPDSKFKKKLNRWVVMAGFEFISGSISVTTRFHNKQNRPAYGIAVSNHTSPIDFMVLATDNCYDTVGQKSKGILGIFLSALSKSSSHIWFDRATAKDRSAVAKRMELHAKDPNLPPLLVFPEGCCVNNTAVIQFKKGVFELDCVIYPIAIRFDPRYGDPFWWQDTFGQYIFGMMTSWAIVCDVFYLPPMKKYPKEGSILFANRVRSVIAHKGGFVELAWDGFIKVHKKNSDTWKKKENDWKKKQQNEFARHLSVEEQLDQLGEETVIINDIAEPDKKTELDKKSELEESKSIMQENFDDTSESRENVILSDHIYNSKIYDSTTESMETVLLSEDMCNLINKCKITESGSDEVIIEDIHQNSLESADVCSTANIIIKNQEGVPRDKEDKISEKQENATIETTNL